jgi:hypothetical protein
MGALEGWSEAMAFELSQSGIGMKILLRKRRTSDDCPNAHDGNVRTWSIPTVPSARKPDSRA